MKKLTEKDIKRLKIAVIACVIVAIIGATAILSVTYYIGWSGFHFYDKAQDGEIKIACVGDSITYGFGVHDWGNCNYPKQLDTLEGRSLFPIQI